MKKIDLVTGFLGSGKTTFIKKYVKYLIDKGEKVCILENDFGAVNVDMMLLSELRGEQCELEMVSGGCDIDCHKRRFKTKLIAMGMDDYTRVVIEPSGIFDTDEFFDSLYDEPLNRWYEIGSVITIVDSLVDDNISDTSRYMLASQVANAGKIVFSKVQNNTEQDIANTKKLIEETLSDIDCDRDMTDIYVSKDFDDFTYEDFEIISNSGYHRTSYIKKYFNHQDEYESIYFLEKNLNKDNLTHITDELIGDSRYGNIIRIKGFFYEDDSWYEINVTNNNFCIKPIEEGQDVLIIIGENLNKDLISDII